MSHGEALTTNILTDFQVHLTTCLRFMRCLLRKSIAHECSPSLLRILRGMGSKSKKCTKFNVLPLNISGAHRGKTD